MAKKLVQPPSSSWCSRDLGPGFTAFRNFFMLLGMDSPGSGAVGFLGEKKASPGRLECAIVGLGT